MYIINMDSSCIQKEETNKQTTELSSLQLQAVAVARIRCDSIRSETRDERQIGGGVGRGNQALAFFLLVRFGFRVRIYSKSVNLGLI